jgi:hypothetical protein
MACLDAGRIAYLSDTIQEGLRAHAAWRRTASREELTSERDIGAARQRRYIDWLRGVEPKLATKLELELAQMMSRPVETQGETDARFAAIYAERFQCP